MAVVVFFLTAITGILTTVMLLVRQRANAHHSRKSLAATMATGIGITTAVSFFSSLIAAGVNIFQNETLIFLGVLNALILGLLIYFVGLAWFGKFLS